MMVGGPMTWGGCRRRKTWQGRKRGMESDAAKAVARSGDSSGGLSKESERERVRKVNGKR